MAVWRNDTIKILCGVKCTMAVKQLMMLWTREGKMAFGNAGKDLEI